MDTFTEKTKPLQGLIHELFAPELRSVDVYDTVAGAIEPMTIVGRKAGGAVTATKTDTVGANKGAIALTGSGFDVGAPLGAYDLICIESYNAAGPVPAVFELVGPDGFHDVVTAGVAYDGPVNFTNAVGTADAAGDKAKIVVAQAAGSGRCVPLAAAGTVEDGSDEPYGIALYGVAKSATPKNGVTLVDLSVVQDGNLTYPAGSDANAKAAINAALRAKGIVVKTGTQMVA